MIRTANVVTWMGIARHYLRQARAFHSLPSEDRAKAQTRPMRSANHALDHASTQITKTLPALATAQEDRARIEALAAELEKLELAKAHLNDSSFTNYCAEHE